MKKTQANPAKKSMNKSEWIRNQPLTLSAKDVVEKAKEAGISLSIAHVYTERSNAKKKAAKQNGKPAAVAAVAVANGTPKASKAPKAPVVNKDDADLRMSFMKLAMRLGTDEARRLIDRVDSSLSQ